MESQMKIILKPMLVALATLSAFAAAADKRPSAKDKSRYAIEISQTNPMSANASALSGIITVTDNISLGLGIPGIVRKSWTANSTTSLDYESLSIPFDFRYEKNICDRINLVVNNQAIYYQLKNKELDTTNDSWGYAFEVGFSHDICPHSKILFLFDAYRYFDPRLGDSNDQQKQIFSGTKIAYQYKI